MAKSLEADDFRIAGDGNFIFFVFPSQIDQGDVVLTLGVITLHFTGWSFYVRVCTVERGFYLLYRFGWVDIVVLKDDGA